MSQPESSSQKLNSLREFIRSLNAESRQELEELVQAETNPIWEPTPGPQTEALSTSADILFYGGAAGGGKTDLLVGAASTEQLRSIIFRREATQLVAVVSRAKEINEGFSYNGQDKILTTSEGRVIEFGSCKDAGDEIKYQGRAHDLKGFDEITHFTEQQFRFLCGWMRSTDPTVRQRVIATGNPPTDSDGEWVKKFWGPWLDEDHPNPAEPGELRYYVTYDSGIETEVDGPELVKDPGTGELIKPKSRTFIPSKIEDNPFLMETGYKATLQALPEPLRSQMLKGDFKAGVEDDPWQVLPSSWVQAAMDRWIQLDPVPEMDSMGVDVARGGRDRTVIATRHGGWFAPLHVFPGKATPNGQAVAGLALQFLRDAAPIHVDVIGVGASAFDHLEENGIQTVPVNAAGASNRRDVSGKYGMVNKRAELYWDLREALDPRSRSLIALPNDPELKADLCAPRFKVTARGIQVESKEDLIKRIGRSPDKGDAVLLAFIDTPKEYSPYEEDDSFRNADDRSEITGY